MFLFLDLCFCKCIIRVARVVSGPGAEPRPGSAIYRTIAVNATAARKHIAANQHRENFKQSPPSKIEANFIFPLSSHIRIARALQKCATNNKNKGTIDDFGNFVRIELLHLRCQLGCLGRLNFLENPSQFSDSSNGSPFW